MGSEPLIPTPGGWLARTALAPTALRGAEARSWGADEAGGGSQKARPVVTLRQNKVVRHHFAVNGARSPSCFCAWKASERKLTKQQT